MDITFSVSDHVYQWYQKHSTKAAAVFSMGIQMFESGLIDYMKKDNEDVYRTVRMQYEQKERNLQVVHDNELDVLRDECESLRQKLTTVYANISQSVTEKCSELETSYEKRLQAAHEQCNQVREYHDKLLHDIRETTAQLLSSKDKETHVYREKWEHTHERICNWLQYHNDSELQELRQIIAAKDAELSTLKSGNFVKGRTGELMIRDILQHTFVDYDIDYKGKAAHECDLHMTHRSGDFIMVESKNKDIITKQDVDKFYHDVKYMESQKRPCIGAVFISIHTRNIPWKGDICLEVVNGCPLLFVGFLSNDDMIQFLPHVMRVFMQYVFICKNNANNGTVQLDTLFKILQNHYLSLTTTKQHIERLRQQQQDMFKTISDLDKSHQVNVQCIEEFLKQQNKLTVQGVMAKGMKHLCNECGYTCSTKRELNAHAKSHNM